MSLQLSINISGQLQTRNLFSWPEGTSMSSGNDIVLDTVTVCVNEALKNEAGSFPDSLKCANVRPTYKKANPFDKNNHRPLSILPLLSKIYERVTFEQASNYFELFFNDILCILRKAQSTQHTLLKLLTLWQNSLDRCGSNGFVKTL